MKGHLPNLIIIGAPKCGTTSLHYYLGLHPQINMSQKKELNFFQREINWGKGEGWYRSHFLKDNTIRGESSTMYSNYHEYPGVPARTHALMPNAKLIYLLRDPIERILSQYVHASALGLSSGSIESCLERLDDVNSYIAYSKYGMQLESYLAYYPLSKILILTAEELLAERAGTLRKVFRFLEVDPDFYSCQFDVLKNTHNEVNQNSWLARQLNRYTSHDIRYNIPESIRAPIRKWLFLPFRKRLTKPVLSQSLRERLVCCLQDDTNHLRRLTERPFEGWSV